MITLQKRAVRYMAGLKEVESYRDSFKQLKILTVIPIRIFKTQSYKKKSSMVLVCKQTIPTERPQPAGEVSADFS
jgi:hypothetical protein